MEGLKFIQANLDHTRAATSHLIDYIEAQAINLAIIGGPLVRSGRLPGLPSRFILLSQTTYPKVLVLANNVPLDPFPVLISPYVVAVKFLAASLSFVLIAVYAAPSADISEILDLVSQALLSSAVQHVIIAGDFNAKSPLWGGSAADARGAEVAQFLAAHSLLVVNDPHILPTFSTDYAQAWIDLTIVSHSLGEFDLNWRVSDSVTLSDHKYILFRLRNRQMPAKRWLTRAGQGRVLESLANVRWLRQIINSPIQNPNSLDLILEHFYDIYQRLRGRSPLCCDLWYFTTYHRDTPTA